VSARFEGRNVLVTGAARGIGRAIVAAFLGEGATVLAADIDGRRLSQTAAELASPRLHTRAGDISDAADAVSMVEHAVATFGRLHVLVNNAGVMPEGPILEVDEAVFERTFATNVRGPFFATQAAARHMCAGGGGAIVSIASANAFHGESPEAPYNASKAAVVALARSFAHELGHLGLRVNCVAPGETMTPEAAAVLDAESLAREREYARRIPMRRPGRVDEQAAAVLFLASDDASFVNGQTLIVDGGELSGRWWNDDDGPPLPDHIEGLPERAPR
jgi:NAD(P)-dependent dehydrogenase (short-subunit alcohol dehydrogenase family)